jgi:Flp pilus assembly protein TadG
MRALTRALRRNRDGNAAVEFALILPVLLALIFACLEFGMIAYTYNATGSVARDAARQLAINQLTPDQVDAYVRKKLPRWVQGDAQMNVSQSDEDDPTTNRFTLDVRFPATSATPSHFMSFAYNTLTVDVRVTMQQEPTL